MMNAQVQAWQTSSHDVLGPGSLEPTMAAMEYQTRADQGSAMQQRSSNNYSTRVALCYGLPLAMTGGESSEPPRKRRKGGKMFSGCGNCRVRKIKCDLSEPNCQNCGKSRRYVCDGYRGTNDLRMADQVPRRSPSSLPPSTTEPSRQPPRNDPATAVASEQTWMGRDLDSLDQNQAQLADLFNSFNTPMLWPELATTPDVIGEEDSNLALPAALSPATDPLLPDYEVEQRQDPQITSGRNAGDRNADEAAPSQPTPKRWIQTDFWSTMNYQLGDIPSVTVMPEKTLNAIPSPVTTGSDLSQTARQLLHHYRTHVCEVMMPTSAPKLNPWLRLYLPLATHEPDSPSSQALLHAILAVAAYNKAQLTPGQREVHRGQAVGHHQKATAMMSKIIAAKKARSQATVDTPESKHALLAATLTLTTVEVFSGADKGSGYDYLLLCRTVIELTGGQSWWLSDSVSMTLLQIFQCLNIVGRISGYFEAPPRTVDELEQDSFSEPEDDPPDGRPIVGHELLQTSQKYTPEYTLDISFGISIKTLSYLHRIIMLSKIKSTLRLGQDWPLHAKEELTKLEREMFTDMESACLDASSCNQATFEGVSQLVANEIKENHMLAFHYSTATFFRRAICDGTADIVPALGGAMNQELIERPSGQSLVSKALEHLENIDALAGDLAIANTLWPGFIAAAEAVDWKLRRRALMWFSRARRHGIGNITKAKALVQEIWRRVDRLMSEDHEQHLELGQVDWREVMHDMGMYIMLT
ncbi:fungal-specific transcription factor domain-containing protein [Exophiala viscosa]|uniref:fungal-specific transcription factor domain-containing protein n=1 Tax=Exophiala viscosa TaxID=2486360 RepID=UPI002197C5F5|nr:fungal-specific transcription factor domain-containing protein [Exophiala viscosa]